MMTEVKRQPLRFIEWDFTAHRATEYRRFGECTQCGACCAAGIHFQHGTTPEGFTAKAYGGGQEAGPEGKWQEVDDGARRVFRRQISEPGSFACSAFHERRCAVYTDRPTICRWWPVGPSDVAAFPQCEYRFEIVQEWDFIPVQVAAEAQDES